LAGMGLKFFQFFIYFWEQDCNGVLKYQLEWGKTGVGNITKLLYLPDTEYMGGRNEFQLLLRVQ